MRRPKTWLTTDTHFNHAKMVEYCGRPEDFEQRILHGWACHIEPADALIHLGDICIGRDEEVHEKFISVLPCKRILIRGNHDRKSPTWYLEHGWTWVCDAMQMNLFGHRIMLSHEPLPEDGDFTINVHGHFHNNGHRKDPDVDKALMAKRMLLCIEDDKYVPRTLEFVVHKWERQDSGRQFSEWH